MGDLRISVDERVCAGSGFCQKIAPELFRLDDSNIARVLQEAVPEELEELAREAYETCPANAIVTTE
jgi:ferredoxin